MHRRYSIAAVALTLLGLTATTAQAANPQPGSAADKAADYVKSRPSKLHASSSDAFRRRLRDTFGWDARVPESGETVTLEPR